MEEENKELSLAEHHPEPNQDKASPALTPAPETGDRATLPGEIPVTPGEIDQTRGKSTSDRPILRGIVTLLMIIVLGALGYLVFQRVVEARAEPDQSVNLGQQPQEAPVPDSSISVASVPFANSNSVAFTGIRRKPELKTTIPDRPHVDVVTYTVQKGDTLFEIADKYGIKPETVLWGNFETLKDNVNFLKEGQVLNILPINGTYYEWQNGDTLDGVASSFKVDAQAIIDFAGNPFDLTALNTPTYGLTPDTWIVVPGGKRPIKDWGPPTITRSNPAAARYYGDGSCGSVYEGAVGNGTFILPTGSKAISGYGYSQIHPGVDFAGALGAPVYAVDNGVVVYSGWSDYGYGYMIVIDHGNGFQSAYAHLSAIAVGCGQSVFQGSQIGSVGSTGNSTGNHLHFELSYNGAKPNPLDYLP